MKTGGYYLFHHATGLYLSCEDRKLTLKRESSPWQLISSGLNSVYIRAKNDLLLDIHNAWLQEGNTVKLWENTGLSAQLWQAQETPGGRFDIVSAADPRLCLSMTDGAARLQLRKRGAAEWLLIPSNAPLDYFCVRSKGGLVELQLPFGAAKLLSGEQLQLWADRLEIAYGLFYELTNYMPFRDIIVEAYRQSPNPGYAGWVHPNSNVIHIAKDFLMRDLQKMALRQEDWNFCALHEMGHMFDFEKPWNFEPELMTDIKVAYVMEMANAAAAPAEFPAHTCFRGANILEAYRRLGHGFSEKYCIFSAAQRFLEIQKQIGWKPFRDTFHSLQAAQSKYARLKPQKKLLLFTDTLSRYSGCHIRSFFTDAEWNILLQSSR